MATSDTIYRTTSLVVQQIVSPANRLIFLRPINFLHMRNFHPDFSNPEPQKLQQKQTRKTIERHDQQLQQPQQVSPVVNLKYKIFRDEESPEIFDVEEERQRQRDSQSEEKDEMQAIKEAFFGLNLQRGINGVFDVEDLVDVLRKENAEDIFVCSVPKELKYVDHMVVCSGRSYRHMLATAEFVRKVFKIKRNKGDVLPKIEGEKSRDWMAMDLGNIALHIFSPTAREEYDLESLWAIGPEYDKEANKPEDPLVELFERYTFLTEPTSKTT